MEHRKSPDFASVEFPPIGALRGLEGARWVKFPMCAYGVDHLKWILPLTNIPELDTRSTCCSKDHDHIPLSGSVWVKGPGGKPVWRARTALLRVSIRKRFARLRLGQAH